MQQNSATFNEVLSPAINGTVPTVQIIIRRAPEPVGPRHNLDPGDLAQHLKPCAGGGGILGIGGTF